MSEVIADGYLVAALSKKSAAPVGNKVGKAISSYPSVVNSLIGAPPMVSTAWELKPGLQPTMDSIPGQQLLASL